ncbi:hypothetical protein ZWY2020_039165 [Hordeum vulgare]|nr:hypothetical protein ZWY2020_039165 [Hordeum vulgare]
MLCHSAASSSLAAPCSPPAASCPAATSMFRPASLLAIGRATSLLVDGCTREMQDHPTDDELFNTPLEHYNYIQLCFANKLATGVYTTASGVPLGKPIVVEAKDKSKVMEGQGTTDEEFEHVPSGSNFILPTASATQDPSPTSTKKRNMTSVLTEEDLIQCSNMTDDTREISSAINNTCHAETHPDLYKAVMDLKFDQNERLDVLDYLTEHKAKGLNFLKINDEVRQAAFKHILKTNPGLL